MAKAMNPPAMAKAMKVMKAMAMKKAMKHAGGAKKAMKAMKEMKPKTDTGANTAQDLLRESSEGWGFRGQNCSRDDRCTLDPVGARGVPLREKTCTRGLRGIAPRRYAVMQRRYAGPRCFACCGATATSGLTLPQEKQQEKGIVYQMSEGSVPHEGKKYWWVQGWIGLPK